MRNIHVCHMIILMLIGIACFEDLFHPDWAVKIDGGEDVAKIVATESGFQYAGKIGNLENIYHFKDNGHSQKRTKRSVIDKMKVFSDHSKVSWAEPQKPLRRTKRSLIPERKEYQEDEDEEIRNMFNDPQWKYQWYIYDNRISRKLIKQDLDIIPVWKMNITGRGVRVTIIDDGLEHTHPDLHDNYDPKSSYDFNDDDNDPFPNLDPGTSNEHGTRCASEIAMVANNKICGVGLAYNAKVGGIRILDGVVNDLVEAKSLGFNNNHIDIYSASWGPTDDGQTMDMPGYLAREALRQGATKGRNGKGNLYVWAAGNGGYFNDSCACDGYASSIYVISINSITPKSSQPGFTEGCSSTMASTFSSSIREKSRLVAADVHGKCTQSHSGTSASAPYAAAVFALALEANPKLSWRDIKHLLAWTSQYVSLHGTVNWQQNAAGFWVNDYFGFGEIDATNLVKNAMSWVTVPPLVNCSLTNDIVLTISTNKPARFVIDGSSCLSKVKFIEHVVLTMTFQYSFRGALQINLKSPNGMLTTLLPLRYLDKSNDVMIDWSFNSVFNWGETPEGLWTIIMEDKKKEKGYRNGTVNSIHLTFFGTDTIPHHIQISPNHRRIYDANYNHVKESKRSADQYRI